MTSFITPHCISVYVVCQNSEAPLYLLIRRCGKYLPGTWQMISGGIESGETASQAALREIQEETGLIPQTLYSADAVETFYMQSNDKITFVPVFVAFVKSQAVHLSPKEHDAYEWLTFKEARDRLVWAEQKRVITHIHNCFVQNPPNPLLLIQNTMPSSVTKPTISRTGVYGVACKDEKLLLVKQRRGPHSEKWDLPGGKIKDRETIENALRREFLEEVGMSFRTMQFLENLTSMTDGVDEQGKPYVFYQIGLVYLIKGISHSDSKNPEMEHAWIDLEQLDSEAVSPFVQQVLALRKEARWTMKN